MMSKKRPQKALSQILTYQTGGGQTRLKGETVWLSQRNMAELYQTSLPNINIHIQNIYSKGELEQKTQKATIKDSLIV